MAPGRDPARPGRIVSTSREGDSGTTIICNGQTGDGQPCPEYGDAAMFGLPRAAADTIRLHLKAAGWRVYVPNPQPGNRERLDFCPAHPRPGKPAPEPVRRPNGKLYQSRLGVVAHEIDSDGDGIATGVLVLGTHDRERAQALADEVARRVAGPGFVAASPETGWYRDGISHGERRWAFDEVHGRAGVLFREIVEV